jgi:hypothetical protein
MHSGLSGTSKRRPRLVSESFNQEMLTGSDALEPGKARDGALNDGMWDLSMRITQRSG